MKAKCLRLTPASRGGSWPRAAPIRGWVRHVRRQTLVYPVGRLWAAHERLKFQSAKFVQPSYLMSPRAGRAQRDNTAAHLLQAEYSTLDLKQFYPSTTRVMIRNSLIAQFGMSADVAGLIVHIATADDKVYFDSPLTLALASIVHRPIFDAIADLCSEYGLSYTVWIVDLIISGDRIPGEFRSRVREIVSEGGLRSHKLKFRTGNRVAFVTGVGIAGAELVVPRRLELRGKVLWQELSSAETYNELDHSSSRLLAHPGSIRHVVGRNSIRGQKLK